jgi:hypothetical protein
MANLGFWIQELLAVRVVAFHCLGEGAEASAFQLMQEWLLQQQLPEGYVPRIFGYTKSAGQPGVAVSGHEVLLTLPPSGHFTPAVSVRTLEPCAYACVTSVRPEWQFVKERFGKDPLYIRQGAQWVVSADHGGQVQRQWLLEHHANAEDIQNCIRTGLTAPQYHHFTIMIPVGRK